MISMNTVRQPKMRSSNIELLRITAMVLVMVLHADFLSIGSPSATDIVSSPAQSFLYGVTTLGPGTNTRHHIPY